MNTGKAFFAGVVGGAAATLILAAARAAGAAPDFAMMMGTLPGNAPSGAAWLAGFILIVLGSGLTGILYAALFETLLHRGGAKAGIQIAAVHMLLKGFFLGLLGAAHPLIPKSMQAPGFFMTGYGALGVLAFVASFLAFGAIMGSLYGDVMDEESLPYER